MQAVKTDAICPALFYTITIHVQYTHMYTWSYSRTSQQMSNSWFNSRTSGDEPDIYISYKIPWKSRSKSRRRQRYARTKKTVAKKTKQQKLHCPGRNLQRRRHWTQPIRLATVLTLSHVVIRQKRKIAEKNNYSESLNTRWCRLLSVWRTSTHQHSRIFRS